MDLDLLRLQTKIHIQIFQFMIKSENVNSFFKKPASHIHQFSVCLQNKISNQNMKCCNYATKSTSVFWGFFSHQAVLSPWLSKPDQTALIVFQKDRHLQFKIPNSTPINSPVDIGRF